MSNQIAEAMIRAIPQEKLALGVKDPVTSARKWTCEGQTKNKKKPSLVDLRCGTK